MDVNAVDERRMLRMLWIRAYLPNLLFATGQGAIIPVLAIAAKHLGASTSLAALIVALNGLGTMLMDVPAGWVVARVGERRAAMLATAMLLSGLVVCFFARHVVFLGLGIFIQATGWSIWSLVRLTNISRITTATTRGRAISIFGGVSRGGQVIGPFLVAALATKGSVRVSFVIYFVFAAIGWVMLESARDRSDAGATHRSTVGFQPVKIIKTHQHEFATAGVSSYVLGVLRSSRQVMLPLWGAHIGLDVRQVALLYGISSVLDVSLFYPAGSISDRFGRRAVALPCIALLAIGHLLLPFTHSFSTMLAVGMVLGFGNGLGAGIVMTLGADRAPDEGRPAFLALWRLVSDAGAASGPMVDGALIGAFSLGVAAPVVGVIGLFATLYTWRFLEETQELKSKERTIISD